MPEIFMDRPAADSVTNPCITQLSRTRENVPETRSRQSKAIMPGLRPAQETKHKWKSRTLEQESN